MQNHPRADVRSLLAAALLLAFAAPSLAAARPAVSLRCAIQAPSLRALYHTKTAGVEQEVCKNLLKRLKSSQALNVWEYTTDAASPLVLRFTVEDGPIDEDLVVRMDLTKSGVSVRPTSPWERTWLTAEDLALHGDPPLSSAAQEIAKAFGPLLQDASLEKSLREHAPIAEGGSLQPATSGRPRIVSTLPWKDFKQLRSSKFRVACWWPAKEGEAELESKGHSGPASYDPDGPDPAYDALVLVAGQFRYEDTLRKVEEAMSDVLTLKPKWIYLLQREPPGLEIAK